MQPPDKFPPRHTCYFAGFNYFKRMWKLILSVPLLLGSFALPAATVQLKDKASVSGKILAEKPGEIVIDIGYTVLVIPRDQILSLLKDTASTSPAVADKFIPI